VTFVLTALGAALACAIEMLEAMAIVLAVALERSWRPALTGAIAGALGCVALAAVLGPLLTAHDSVRWLRVVIGIALLAFGLNWLRKNVLRLAGRKKRSTAYGEFEEEREELRSHAEWSARAVAAQGVFLEGLEVVLIVSALAARPGQAAPAFLGAGVALVATVAAGVVMHRPLRRLPETHMKFVVGVMLSAFGTFFIGEGLRLEWPLGDAALLVLVALWLGAALLAVRLLTPRHEIPGKSGEMRVKNL
jgi:uncharacterized membrane protein